MSSIKTNFKRYQMAVECGYLDEIATIMYCVGEGTEKNLERAIKWYQKEAEGGNVMVMFNLANIYFNEERTEKNLEWAFYWCQKQQRVVM